MRVGETVVLGDGRGSRATGSVVFVGRDTLRVRIAARESVPRPTPEVILAQALVKGDRGELAVELATEAGVDAVLPWRAARCVARWESGPRGEKALGRWRSSALAAAKQSRRAWLPTVGEPVSTSDLSVRCAALGAPEGLALVLHESAEESLAATIAAAPAVTRLLLVVGPEGGVSDEELDKLTAAGARPVRLGPEVLRASTAAVVALGAIGALTTRW
jgi:16S rRNA (uracil1498-N3)-methyltransferase